jgi:transcriptional regulator with XRE-family HTH domain
MEIATFDRRELKRIRERHGISQRQLSLALGFHPRYIYHVEIGRYQPSLEKLQRIAAYLHVPELIVGDIPHTQTTWVAPSTQAHLRYENDLFEGESWLSISNCIHTYLIADPLRVWFQSKRFRSMNWSPQEIHEYLDRQLRITESVRSQIKLDRYRHELILREGFFREAASQEPDWVRETAKIITQLRGITDVYLADDDAWPIACSTIRKSLGITGFCGISVFGNRVLTIRHHCGGRMSESRSTVEVEAVSAVIDRVKADLPHGAYTAHRLGEIALRAKPQSLITRSLTT